MMTVRLRAICIAVCSCVSLCAQIGRAQSTVRWADDSARLIAKGQLQAGVLSSWAYGLAPKIQLNAHPIGALLLPGAGLKVQWLTTPTLQLASVHRLSYPTALFNLVAREGTLGLLPANQTIGSSVMLESKVIGTTVWQGSHALSAAMGITAASHDVLRNQPFDFPFLFQRLGPTANHWSATAQLTATGAATSWLGYEVGAQTFIHLPEHGWAYEAHGALWFAIGSRQRIIVQGRVSRAALPVGIRTHWLPLVDYQLSFGAP